jgi:uncharacterized cupin superfamily protein
MARANRASYHPAVVPEAELEQTDAGLVPAGAGWFVMNARDGRWFHRPGRGDSIPLTGADEVEAETYFPMLGMSIQVLAPGEPNSVYHWETEQEDFLVLSGRALLVVEGKERPLEQWDFVHCPPGTRHVFVGAGAGACVILAVSSRQFQENGPWGSYSVDAAAERYGASAPEETQDGDLAYSRFPPSQAMPYRDGSLPAGSLRQKSDGIEP